MTSPRKRKKLSMTFKIILTWKSIPNKRLVGKGYKFSLYLSAIKSFDVQNNSDQ